MSPRVAGVIHFIWGQKADYEEPIKWAVWLAVLLGDPAVLLEPEATADAPRFRGSAPFRRVPGFVPRFSSTNHGTR